MQSMSKRKAVFLVALLFSVFSFYLICRAEAPDELTVKRVGNIVSFRENIFRISSPEDGLLSISVHDDISVYRTICQKVASGTSEIAWDGCGFNREKLYPKSYTITCRLDGDSGKQYYTSFLSPVEYTGQCLQYALPSGKTASLSDPEDWFLEYKTVMKGKVSIDFVSVNSGDKACSYQASTVGGKIYRKSLASLSGKHLPDPGLYTVSVYEVSTPDNRFEFEMEIILESPEKEGIFTTGEIVPDRGMSDQEIWQMMMQPSVVVDIDFFKHQSVYSEPDEKSRSLGTLHGQTQALKVIRIEGEWTLIGAWNHENAEYVEGWVPTDKLKVEYPQTQYGLLIDKKMQTLTVFESGVRKDTLLVSTGRPEKKQPYQETSAGSFLTGYHRVDFSMNGQKYDYVIQYDGGNLLHQIPYAWGKNKKDFSNGRGYLGAKASHACIRIQSEPGEGGLNAYWIWTHIPYHTRVIILDDPEERHAMTEILNRTDHEPFSDELLASGEFSKTNKDTVLLSFSGLFLPGGQKSFNERTDSFVSSYISSESGNPLAGLAELFELDELTCVNLECPLENESIPVSPQYTGNIAPGETVDLFSASSVEMVCLNNDAFPTKEMEEDTARILENAVLPLKNNGIITTEINGHLFGLAAFHEEDYLKDPSSVDSALKELSQFSCERIICLCYWGEGSKSTHTVIQEALAHRCVRQGADLVIGYHPQTVQGIEYYNQVPIIYSLGMLLDGSSAKSGAHEGLLVEAEFDFNNGSSTSVSVFPVNPEGSFQFKNCPAVCSTFSEAENTLLSILADSSDSALKQTIFRLQTQ